MAKSRKPSTRKSDSRKRRQPRKPEAVEASSAAELEAMLELMPSQLEGLPEERVLQLADTLWSAHTMAAATAGQRARAKVASPAHDPSVRDEWDEICQDIWGLTPLLRVIECHIDMLHCDTLMNDLTAGDVSNLAGLAYRRLNALSERMTNGRPAPDSGWDS